jgi:hypothetical protein
VQAASLLQADPDLGQLTPNALWRRVLGGESKRHNGQMDVVLGLHRAGLLKPPTA